MHKRFLQSVDVVPIIMREIILAAMNFEKFSQIPESYCLRNKNMEFIHKAYHLYLTSLPASFSTTSFLKSSKSVVPNPNCHKWGTSLEFDWFRLTSFHVWPICRHIKGQWNMFENINWKNMGGKFFTSR